MQGKKPAGRYLVDARGRREAVMFSVDDYRQLMEDFHDLAVVAERRREGTVALDEIRRRARN